ncbi:hypothetical protein [Actinocatenispora comari]|uniref:Uncharacterized protein n=1 Tax=Actinocatenispora comari TaxID=2807577 RepID=A0A8J4AF55_9ACTN|nr:hypothetical protein [Actinocatenispora comari]GIL29938.1 hypothetical protein NUM_51920 [Actinocatenispora comari]
MSWTMGHRDGALTIAAARGLMFMGEEDREAAQYRYDRSVARAQRVARENRLEAKVAELEAESAARHAARLRRLAGMPTRTAVLPVATRTTARSVSRRPVDSIERAREEARRHPGVAIPYSDGHITYADGFHCSGTQVAAENVLARNAERSTRAGRETR